MAREVNFTRLAELAARYEDVLKAGLLPVVIPQHILDEMVLNPDYIPRNLPAHILIITYTCISVSFLAIVMRFVARFGNRSSVWLDDWFSVGAWLAAVGFAVSTLISVHMGGLGKHIWLLTDDEIDFAYMTAYLHQITCGIASFFLHVAIMFFYIRLIPREHRARKLVYAFFVFHLIYFPASVMVFALQCRPARSGWDLRYRINLAEANKCMDPIKLVTALTSINIITDCLLFLLPITVVWDLALELKQKIMVSGLFSLGILACVTSGVRLHYLRIFFTNFDRTYYAMPVNALGHIEMALGLLCACLPMMRQTVLMASQGIFSRSGSSCIGGNKSKSRTSDAHTTARTSRTVYTSRTAVENEDQLGRSLSFGSRRMDIDTQGDGSTVRLTELPKYIWAETPNGRIQIPAGLPRAYVTR